MWIFIALLFIILVGLNFHSRRHSLRVLMYHKISVSDTDFMTVTTEKLRQQLSYLRQENYQFVSLPVVLEALKKDAAISLPRRAVLVTFDDAYQNNLTNALPILQEFAVPPTIFVSTAFVGGTNEWDGSTEPILTSEELKCLASQNFTLAYHSHRHLNYKNQSPEAIQADLITNVEEADRLGLPMARAFSYPYGGRPKAPAARRQMIDEMEQLGIGAAFRIGNRINPIPIRDPYDLNRIDVRGTDSFAVFTRKVRWGKLM
jgi:peptidoglycan/xylan/chitin deacetylase (PgdA/CDA1 family)